ncbi:MAG: radical SAM protein [bacterium]|nr:radical SAM protein [bacterium]
MVELFKSSVVNLEKLNSIFIELTAKNCNQRCQNCYINFPVSKNIKDFISLDKIKSMLKTIQNDNVEYIFLTGAEPMTHPEFNSILRLCLKKTNVVICTNASFINEKKSRFLKKVEDEFEHEIIFLFTFVHYDELKNDSIRYRGSFRQVLSAVKCLSKYGFNPIFNILNYYQESSDVLIKNFIELLSKIGFSAERFNFQIREFYNADAIDFEEINIGNYDCATSRTLTSLGIYACPFLANDHRGWTGNDFTSYSKQVYLETDFCATCAKNKNKMFGFSFDT